MRTFIFNQIFVICFLAKQMVKVFGKPETTPEKNGLWQEHLGYVRIDTYHQNSIELVSGFNSVFWKCCDLWQYFMFFLLQTK